MTLGGFRAIPFNWDTHANTHPSKHTHVTDRKSRLCPERSQMICQILIWTNDRDEGGGDSREEASDLHNIKPPVSNSM